MFKLYKHQKIQNKFVRESLKVNSHVLFGATTGFGKSVAIWDIVGKELEAGRKVLLLAPRKTLVEQLTDTLKQYNPFMIINSKRFGNPKSKLIVSSKQTTNRQLNLNPAYKDIDTIIIDEVHLGGNFPPKPNTEFHGLYQQYWDSAKWIGFSATPITAKGYKLEGWDECIYKYQTKQLIEMGYLADYDYYAPEEVDLSGLRVNNMGEYQAEDIEKVTNMPTAIGSVKKQWLKYRKKKKILIFASSINHAKLLHSEFDNCGIIHSKQSDVEQKNMLKAFKSGEITTIINVGILTTGFDDPTVDCLILARPIRSDLLAIQVWGRALRLSKGQKKRALILDMCNVWENCGLPKDIRNWNREYVPREKMNRDDENMDKTMKCPHCKEIFHTSEMKIKKKVKKKFIVTRKKCPLCNKLIDELRTDLVEVEKLRKIEEAKNKTYTNEERYDIIKKLVVECTSAKPLWAKYILRSIIKAKNLELLDQALNKGTQPKTTFKKILEYRGQD
jgi:superfamily II DNA or RNA helicase